MSAIKPLDSRIAEMKSLLETDEGRRDPELVAFMIRDWPETREYGLYELAYLLASSQYGCHINDVKGLLEDLMREWIVRGDNA